MSRTYRGLNNYEKLVGHMKKLRRELMRRTRMGQPLALQLYSRYCILSWMLAAEAPSDLAIWQLHETVIAVKGYETDLGIAEKE